MRNAVFGLVLALFVAGGAPDPAFAKRKKKPPALKIKKTRPHNAQTLVPLNVAIAVTFARPIELSSVTSAICELKTLDGSRTIPLTFSLQKNGKELLARPAYELAPATDYRFLLKPGVLSDKGTTLKDERYINFFTTTKASPFALLRPDQFEVLDAKMVEGRAAHSACLLEDGRTLLAAGMSDYTTYATSGELFDPGLKRFVPAGGPLVEGRQFAPMVRFDGGGMLVAGYGPNGALRTTEIYFPQASQFVPGPPLLESRDYVAAVELADGRVLVTGGLSYGIGGGALYSLTAEIYDPQVGGFRFTMGAPLARRAGHTLTLLPDGTVLVLGGESSTTSAAATAEIFDPETETFRRTTFSPTTRRQLHTTTLLDDLGRVLVADGGTANAEFYDPANENFYLAGATSSLDRTGATASLLPDGRVLIAGGLETRDASNWALDGMDLWLPELGDHGAVVKTNVIFPEPRYGHTATTMTGGRVLFAGGFGQSDPASLDVGVWFTPDPPK